MNLWHPGPVMKSQCSRRGAEKNAEKKTLSDSNSRRIFHLLGASAVAFHA
jgi:hypothetical protein